MSENTELRRMLDERGVEWWPMHDVENGYHQDRDTEFVIDGKKYTAHEWGGTLNVYGFTPEQAIAATLGLGTCKLTRASWDDGTCTWGCICSACNAHLEHETGIGYNFCPICGAKVVDE